LRILCELECQGWPAARHFLGDQLAQLCRPRALEPFEPNAVIAFGPAENVPLLEGKNLVDGKPAVYVCERFACRRPVTSSEELAALGAEA
jgi:uncharacterized protein YyaL (SSP411 family)